MGLSTVDVQSEVQKEEDSGLHRKTDGMLSRGRTDMGLERWGVYDALGSPECPPGSPSHGRGLRQGRAHSGVSLQFQFALLCSRWH